jgi:hypothetical protein
MPVLSVAVVRGVANLLYINLDGELGAAWGATGIYSSAENAFSAVIADEENSFAQAVHITPTTSYYPHTDLVYVPLNLVTTPGTPLRVPGAIVTSSLLLGGSGWAQGDTFEVDTQSNGGAVATGVVDSVNAGAIATYHITSPGGAYWEVEGYETTTLTATGGSSGINAELTILSTDVSDHPLTLTIKTLYSILKL